MSNSLEESPIPPFNPLFQHSFVGCDGATIAEQEKAYASLCQNIHNLADSYCFVVECDTIANGRNFVAKLLNLYVQSDKTTYTDIRWINLASCGWDELSKGRSDGIVVISELNGSRCEMASNLNELHIRATRIYIAKPGKYRAYELVNDNIDKPDCIFSIKEKKIVSRSRAN